MQVDGRVGHRVVVERPDHHLAEAAGDQTWCQRVLHVVDLGVRADVDNRAGSYLCAGGRVVIGRVLRLDDQHADSAVAPTVDAVDVVMPEDVVEQCVRVPPVADPLDTGTFAGDVVVVERAVEGDGLGRSIDRHNRGLLDALGSETYAEGNAGTVLRIDPIDLDRGGTR